ncbi:Uncharacterised protein [Slackia heliotrinireducens]|uniref:hypothetical protein n=1 Tax=Slackia heliotrinireducens TaxID=84110 RepID=UPI000F6C3D88|nr:hypothetical protein [Slackia heliotrinireducens]VEH02323.1 Uncharacterised protein [Slackia heliotrinireducens]
MVQDNQVVREPEKASDYTIDDRDYTYDPYKPDMGLDKQTLALIEEIKSEIDK